MIKICYKIKILKRCIWTKTSVFFSLEVGSNENGDRDETETEQKGSKEIGYDSEGGFEFVLCRFEYQLFIDSDNTDRDWEEILIEE